MTRLLLCRRFSALAAIITCHACLAPDYSEASVGQCPADSNLERACVQQVSCDPNVPPFDISYCIAMDPLSSCLRNIQTCDDFTACTGRRYGASNACSAGETGWKCSSPTLAVFCPSSGSQFSVDCSKLGAVCNAYTQGGGTGYWPCRVDPATSCSDTDPSLWHCSGNFNYHCLDGIQYGEQCDRAEYSRTCVEQTAGKAFCTLGTSTCASPKTFACSGNVAVSCSAYGYSYQSDCSRGGGTCDKAATTFGTVCGAQSGCPGSTGSCFEQCVGDSVMSVCVHGAPYQIDCKSYGYSTCKKWTDPKDSTNFLVYCGN